MDEELKRINLLINGLRNTLRLSQTEFAASWDIALDDYQQYEAGKKDFSISLLKSIATRYNIDLTTLMFDEEPRMNTYSITLKL